MLTVPGVNTALVALKYGGTVTAIVVLDTRTGRTSTEY